MKMPGFTAEVSLHKMDNLYHRFKIQHQAYGTIHPAYFGETGFPELDPDADLSDYTEPDPPRWGTVRGEKQEELFISCLERCRSRGGTSDGCKRTCCKQLTGNYSCLIA